MALGKIQVPNLFLRIIPSPIPNYYICNFTGFRIIADSMLIGISEVR
jgi:hypothetical protein